MKRRLRKAVQVTDPLSPVRLAPVAVRGTEVSQVAVEILDDAEDWRPIAIHGEGYQLISNSIVQETAREIISMSPMTWKEEKTIWTGGYLSTLYRSDQIVEIPEVDDAVALGLRVTNSYDGSAKFRLDLMAFILSCLNGLMTPRYFKTYTLKHVSAQEFNLDEAVSIITGGVVVLEKIVPRIAALSSIPLNLQALSHVANKINLPNRDWAYVVKHIGEAHSLWDLMQLATHQITHAGQGRAVITKSERVGDFFLGDLVDRIPA